MTSSRRRSLVAAACLMVLQGSAGLLADDADRWPGFRGAGDSVSSARDLPLKWSDEQNVAWRVELPGVGQSSPVVWQDRLYAFSTEGARKERYHLSCLDLETGARRWMKTLPASKPLPLDNMHSQASATPVIDAAGVYALLDTGDMVAFSHEGQSLWQRNLAADYGPLKNNHGIGTSPVLHDGRLLLMVAHGEGSYLLSLDAATGRTQWRTERDFGGGWTTPAVWREGGVVVVSASGVVEGFDLASGKHLWTVDGFKGNFVPSPTIHNNVAYIGSNESGTQAALELSRDAAPKVLWRTADAACSFGSPLAYEGRLYFTNKVGIAQALDAATGKVLWTERLPASCWASPVGNSDRVYFFSSNGSCTVYQTGDALRQLAQNKLTIQGRLYGAAFVSRGIALRTENEIIVLGPRK